MNYKISRRLSKTNFTESESKELEELALTFGKKFEQIYIERASVYGLTSNEKMYLGTPTQYSRYKELKKKSKKPINKAHQSLLESLETFQFTRITQ
jgi:exopolyphosphatase/pppGpp-phosphohydrolase